jgi:hypothetical protein
MVGRSAAQLALMATSSLSAVRPPSGSVMRSGESLSVKVTGKEILTPAGRATPYSPYCARTGQGTASVTSGAKLIATSGMWVPYAVDAFLDLEASGQLHATSTLPPGPIG